MYYDYDKNYTLFNAKNQADTKYNYNDLIGIISNNTFLSIAIYWDLKGNVRGDEFIQAELPIPTIFIDTGRYYILAYTLLDKPNTKEAQQMYLDLQKRFCKTIINNSTAFKVIPLKQGTAKYIMLQNLDKIILSNNKYGMRYLSNISSLESLEAEKENSIKFEKEKFDKLLQTAQTQKEIKILEKLSDDAIFDTLRELAYRFYSANSYITEEVLYKLGLSAGVPEKTKKGRVLEYKSRAIVEWINKNYNSKKNFVDYKRKTKNDKELEMTRRENMIKLNEKKFNEARKKIMNMITGMFADEYKKKDGSFNIMKLSKDLKMSRTTITKHLKLLKEEGII